MQPPATRDVQTVEPRAEARPFSDCFHRRLKAVGRAEAICDWGFVGIRVPGPTAKLSRRSDVDLADSEAIELTKRSGALAQMYMTDVY